MLISKILLDVRENFEKLSSTRTSAFFSGGKDVIVVNSEDDKGAPNGISGAPILFQRIGYSSRTMR
ncbi:MAG TPA: hypothetical protein ENG58_01875 [Thermotogales bacterium]|nr:hypothetical protein [Thermotogales bacterium]